MIDVKTLRIGSHVLAGGKRIRICGITKRKVGYHLIGKPCERLTYVMACEVEPIPITPELLKELGFEELKSNPPKDPEVRRNTDGIKLPKIYLKTIGNAEIRMVDTYGKDWRIQAYMDGYVVIFGCVEYLHEVEMLVYQAMDVELITD